MALLSNGKPVYGPMGEEDGTTPSNTNDDFRHCILEFRVINCNEVLHEVYEINTRGSSMPDF
jgi:hypothetical protein